MPLGMSRSLADDNITTSNDESIAVIADGEGTGRKAYVTTENRLKVDAAVSSSVAPNTDQQIQCLLNGSERNIGLANGSSGSPVYYTWQPSSGIWRINDICCAFLLSADPASTDFGGSTALTNGVVLEYSISSTIYTIATIQTNLCISMVFHHPGFLGNTADKWFKDAGGRYYVGVFDVTNANGSIILNSANSDYIRVKVQDNLTTKNIVSFVITNHVMREI